ncbi:MAG: HNH endonuclease [Nitrospirae bacterium]|nr:HNH endonuclease [Nitrospirota bacterium]
MSRSELTVAFNTKFKLRKTENQVISTLKNHGIVSGRTGRFEKGQKSWNKGVKGYMGANRTSFKKGNAPKNRKPIGHERIRSKDGFILMKVAEKDPYTKAQTRYKHKHVHIWEKKHGKVPDGMVVAFKDGDNMNCVENNLMLLSRAELLLANQHRYKDMPIELKPSILALVKLEAKAGFRTSGYRGGRKKNLSR